MDEQGDYPIKVLDMAPLIMVTLPTVSFFFSTCGCFLRDGRCPSGDLPSLSSLCMVSQYEWLSPREWRCLQDFRVEDPSGARKGGPNRRWKWARPAGLGWPAQAHLGPARSPLRTRGSSSDYALCPPPLTWFWRCHPRVQDGGSPCMKFGLLHFNPRGCSFVALRSSPPSEVI
jgi:hypothetical protein